MSLNEIAVDLTCEPAEFALAKADFVDEEPVPGRFTFPTNASNTGDNATYQVHGGILRMAMAMGGIGKPVHLTVHGALYQNPDYELIICGHSLGAGVAAMLGLMWADAKTCRTVRSSGLPEGRHVSVYCFAPPCTADLPLAKISEDLIVSFVYSHDVVSRLSIGTVTDLRNAALWLCDAHASTEFCHSGHSAVIERAGRWKSGFGSAEDPQWFIALRTTLEANMNQPKKLYPPGRVLWALRDGDLCHSHRLNDGSSGLDKLRLFEVTNVEKTFSQIIFAKDMLSAHLPHNYDSVLHDLL